MIPHTVMEMVGNTPLIAITHLGDEATILAKAEFMNPGGSVKDRIARQMIDAALARGTITPQTTLIEPTSGNTGIGLAMVCAARGMNLVLTMPESMSLERRKLLEHLGAQIILTPAALGMQGSIDEARRLVRDHPHAHMLDQFANPDNPEAHRQTTAPEILDAHPDPIDFLALGVGTGGSLMGIGSFLKAHWPDMTIIAVEPADSAVLSGHQAGAHAIQGIGAGFIPPIFDPGIPNAILTVTNDEAIRYARQAAQQAGLLIGISSGANLAAAHRLARDPHNRGKTILTLLPDTGERYLSTDLFEG